MDEIINRFREVLLRPAVFFKKIQDEKGYGRPWLFFAVVMGVYYSLSWVSMLPSTVIELVKDPELQGVAGIIAFALTFVLLFVMILALVVISVFLTAGILHIFLYIAGARSRYQQTFKVVCYSQAPIAFLGPFVFLQIIPLVGSIAFLALYVIVWLWTAILQVLGASRLHKISYGRAIIGVVVLPIIFWTMVIILLVMFFSAMVLYAGMSSVSGYLVGVIA